MEMEEIEAHHQGCSKFQRIGNGNGNGNVRMAHNGDDPYPDDEDDRGELKRGNGGAGGGGGLNISSSHGGGVGVGSVCGWPSSSRIVRVSRASGGKDRHSKVLTSKGLRDRRVRLSVNTAIQFYDLQDRLGYDQPSKAVEWLLKAAAPSIADLPSLNPPFTELSDERRPTAAAQQEQEQEQPLDSADIEMEGDHHNMLLLSKSCSSTSETSKGSGGGLSLSRSEGRIKARERARERTAEKEKEKENNNEISHHHHHNLNPISSSSFTELLTGTTSPNNDSAAPQTRGDTNFFAKSPTPMDYFTSGLLCQTSTRPMDHHSSSSAFPGNIIQLTNPLAPVSSPLFNMGVGELQHFSFVSDHLAPPGNNGNAQQHSTNNNNNNNNNNLSFSISPCSSSSGLPAGFNRGTLQSNSSSPSLLPHFQRFPPFDGSSPSPGFFTISSAADNHHHQHHHFLPGFDARLQLYYGDPARPSDNKGKGKN